MSVDEDGRLLDGGATRDEFLGIAGEVDATALPGRTEHRLANRNDEAAVRVADRQTNPRQPALDQ